MNERWWLSSFPRKVGYPAKMICKTKEEFIANYNKMNGVVNKFYVCLYGTNETGMATDITLNLAALDIDWDGKLETMREIHNKLVDLDWKHQVLFSTNGFWIYVLCEPRTYPAVKAKAKLAAMQDHLIEGTSAVFGKSKLAPIDVSIRGDVERLTRMPTSYDRIRGRFAIFLDQADIDQGMDHIIKLSVSCDPVRRFKVYTFGSKIELDPDKLADKPMYESRMTSEFTDAEYTFKLPEDSTDLNQKIMEMFPKYMHSWFDTENCTWNVRALLALFLREKGFDKGTIEGFLKPIFIVQPRSDQYKNNWEHFEGVRCLDLLFRRSDLKFPSFKKLYADGLVAKEIVDQYGEFESPAYRTKGYQKVYK